MNKTKIPIDELNAILAAVSHTLKKDQEEYNKRIQDQEYNGFEIAYNILQKSYEEAIEFNIIYKNYLNEIDGRKAFSISTLAVILRALYENLKAICYFFNFTLSGTEDIKLKVLIYDYQFQHTIYYLRKISVDKIVEKNDHELRSSIKDLQRHIIALLEQTNINQENRNYLDKMIKSENPFSESYILHKDLDFIDKSFYNEDFKRMYTLLSSFSHCGAYSLGIYGLRKYEEKDSKTIILFYEYLISIIANIFIEYKLFCQKKWQDKIELNETYGESKINIPTVLEKYAKNIRTKKWKFSLSLTDQD